MAFRLVASTRAALCCIAGVSGSYFLLNRRQVVENTVNTQAPRSNFVLRHLLPVVHCNSEYPQNAMLLLRHNIQEAQADAKVKKGLETVIRQTRHNLEQKEIHHVVNTFKYLDKSKDGYLSLKEMQVGMKAIGVDDPELVRSLFEFFDANGSGEVDIQEFAVGVAILLKGKPETKLRFMFDVCDFNHDDEVSQSELRHVIKTLLQLQARLYPEDNLTREQDPSGDLFAGLTPDARMTIAANAVSAEIFLQADVNHDGAISYAEFINWIHSKTEAVKKLEKLFETFEHQFAPRSGKK
eukprot:m.8774 g.8774  ORF g.8774 m.8774 type:complete len:296 (-) comp7059_c0_seq1:227-1114(-)